MSYTFNRHKTCRSFRFTILSSYIPQYPARI
jgi:predicted ATP-grasp superfamily ATP-dependent carboligase